MYERKRHNRRSQGLILVSHAEVITPNPLSGPALSLFGTILLIRLQCSSLGRLGGFQRIAVEQSLEKFRVRRSIARDESASNKKVQSR